MDKPFTLQLMHHDLLYCAYGLNFGVGVVQLVGHAIHLFGQTTMAVGQPFDISLDAVFNINTLFNETA